MIGQIYIHTKFTLFSPLIHKETFHYYLFQKMRKGQSVEMGCCSVFLPTFFVTIAFQHSKGDEFESKKNSGILQFIYLFHLRRSTLLHHLSILVKKETNWKH